MANSNQLPFRLFFKLFPLAWWAFIVMAIMMKLLFPSADILFNAIINVSITVLALKLATIFHEGGHLAAAAIAGGSPKRMVLGTGHEVFRARVGRIQIIINNLPSWGFAFASFDAVHYKRWRYAFYLTGGVAMNLIVFILAYLLFGFQVAYLTGRHGVDIGSSLVVANAVFSLNLLPFTRSSYGISLPSDGLALPRILFGDNKLQERFQLQDSLFDAFEFLESRDYDKALEIYRKCLESQPGSMLPLLNISLIQLYQGKIEEALALLEKIERNIHHNELKHYQGLVYNNLGWIHLVKNNIDLAYRYSHKAIKLTPKSNFTRGTYGAVLIEKGKLDTGIQWLAKNSDLDYPNSITLSSSSYLMVAYHQKGEVGWSNVHRNYVEQHHHLLQEDERILFERNLVKIGARFGVYDPREAIVNGETL